jgi:hypothetical protein
VIIQHSELEGEATDSGEGNRSLHVCIRAYRIGHAVAADTGQRLGEKMAHVGLVELREL